MAERIIKCQVDDEYVKGAGVVAGAEGSHDDVLLELAFGDLWDGLTKKITWVDARGGNPTIQILTVDLLKPGETKVYLVPIPYNAKAYEGEMAMSIKGMKVVGGQEQRASMTATAKFIILPSVYDEDADEQGDITATQAAQMQQQIDNLIDDIGAVRDHLDEARESAEAAALSEANAAGSAASAASSAYDARHWAYAAADSAGTASAPLFIATYGVTTYGQVAAAIEQNKAVVARRRGENANDPDKWYFLSSQLSFALGDVNCDGIVDTGFYPGPDDLSALVDLLDVRDWNGNGQIDLSDYIQSPLKADAQMTRRQQLAADANKDGQINGQDMQAINDIAGTWGDEIPEIYQNYVFLGVDTIDMSSYRIRVATLSTDLAGVTSTWEEAEYTNVSSVNGKTGDVTLLAADISDLEDYLIHYDGIPTKTSDLVNDSGFLTSADVKAADAAPLMDGTAAVGTSTDYAREDHVHPKDTSKANLASPTFTGTPKAPTAAAGTNNTQIATTKFVNDSISAMLAGAPQTTTAPEGDDSTRIATTAFVQAAIAASVVASREVIWAEDSVSNVAGRTAHTITAPAGHDYLFIANVRSTKESTNENVLELMLEGGLFADTYWNDRPVTLVINDGTVGTHATHGSGAPLSPTYITAQLVDIIRNTNEDQVITLRTLSADGYDAFRASRHITMALIPIN